MVKKYVHLSGKDAENAILELHGIKVDGKDSANETVQLKSCYRCSEQNTPESQRCSKCGFILDERLYEKIVKDDQSVLNGVITRLEKIEKIGCMVENLLDEITKQDPVKISITRATKTKPD